MDRFDRYLRVMLWLRKRCTVKGELIVSIGGTPTSYTRLESLAYAKYLA